MTSAKSSNRYSHLHTDPTGPGDARPTSLKIVQDNHLVGKLSTKTMLVTGGSSGIGVETVRALATTGATIFFTARDAAKGEVARKNILRGYPEEGIKLEPEKVQVIMLDLKSLDSVRAAAEEIKKRINRLDVLICNAGIAGSDQGTTVDGFDLQFHVNYLSHFLLFRLLEPLLLKSSTPASGSRVVMLTSVIHKFGAVKLDDYNFRHTAYDPFVGYTSSKCAMIWCANEIERRYGARGLHSVSVHPGGIITGLQDSHGAEYRQAMEPYMKDPEIQKMMKSPDQGAATTVLAAVGKDLEGNGGFYLEDCGIGEPMVDGTPPQFPGYAPWAFDEAGEKKLWADSSEMVGLSTE